MADPHDITDLQQYAELGRISASLLHEMSTPLSAALLQLEQIKGEGKPEIKQIHQNMQSLQLYLEAARQQVSHNSPSRRFAIKPNIMQVERIIRPLARRAGTQLIIEPIPERYLDGDPVKFQHILSNLLVNAIEAYPKPTIEPITRPVKLSWQTKSGRLLIRVSDKGEGITPEQLNQLFKPFYTTKQATRGGLGIGLNIVQKYVASFEGEIKVTSSARYGTRFTVDLPLAGSVPVATAQ